MKQLKLFLVLSLLASLAQSQTPGVVTGRITDEMNSPVAGVTISVLNTSRISQSDTLGNYSLSLPQGSYKIVFSSVNFVTDTVTIELTSAPLTRNVVLLLSDSRLGTVTVSGRKERESESAMNMERKQSNLVIQKIGVREMERKGVSNVAEGLTKVTGVSVVGSQQLFIRGLGDRYNNAVLNGLPVPSTNPDFKTIPLEIFPTGIVRNLSVVKSYSANYFGDFSGGTIDILTREYPNNPFFKVSITSGFNSLATGQDFYRNKPNTPSFLGFTRNDRRMPAEVSNEVFYESKPNNQTNPFNVPFSPTLQSAMPRMGVSLSGGNLKRFESGKELGFVIHGSFKNNFRIYRGLDRLLNANEVELFANQLDNYTYTTNTSVLASLYFKANNRTTISYNSLFVNDTDDNVLDIDGENPDLGPVFTRLNTNIQNTLWVNQLHGKHKLGGSNSFNWSMSYSTTQGSLPDRTQTSFLVLGTGPGRNYYFNRDVLGNTHKFFGQLNESDYAFKAEFEHKRPESAGKQLLKSYRAGIDARFRDRSFSARQIDVRTTAIRHPVNPFNVDTTLTERRLGDGFAEGTWKFVETYYPSNNYDASLLIPAAYIVSEMALTPRTDLIAGIRFEYSQQSILYKQSNDPFDRPKRNFPTNQMDFLPFATLKYNLDEKRSLMFSASRTLTRPLFLELAPFRYNQGFNRLPREGNPFLQTSVNYNADLKFEIYPSKAELLAITVFGKRIERPIEQILIISSDRLTTFFNSNSAILAGAEVEIVRNLAAMFGSASNFLKKWGVGFNAAYIYSQIDLDPRKVNSFYPISPTNTSRPMFGASPFLVNADLNFKQQWSAEKSTVATVTYNVYGRRLVFAGSFGAGDVYEMPAGTLDLNINNQISKRMNIDVSLGNILDPRFRQSQFFEGQDFLINDFRRGVSGSLTIGYTF